MTDRPETDGVLRFQMTRSGKITKIVKIVLSP
jgi:hypothetical protein